MFLLPLKAPQSLPDPAEMLVSQAVVPGLDQPIVLLNQRSVFATTDAIERTTAARIFGRFVHVSTPCILSARQLDYYVANVARGSLLNDVQAHFLMQMNDLLP